MAIALVATRPSNENPAIRSDGRGYHIWTRALLERDLSFRRYTDVEGVLPVDPIRNAYQNKYPPGVALIRFPVMAWLVDRRLDAPLISRAEHWASLLFGALMLCSVWVLTLDACRALSVRADVRNQAMLAVAFGTGLFHYATFEGSFSHVYSAAFTAMLLRLGSQRIDGTNDRLPFLTVSLASFLFILVRNTNIFILVALAAAYAYVVGHTLESRSRLLVRDLSAIASGALSAVTLQLAYNGYATHSLTLSSYGPEEFVWNRPMQASVLFSYERGLFTYYPIMALVLLTGALARRTRLATLWFCLLLLAYVCLYGFWHSWMLGCGFGHRGFVDVTPIAVVLFAVALAWIPSPWRTLVVACSFLCALVTLRLMIGYWEATIPACGATRKEFWSVLVGDAAVPKFFER